MDYRLTFDPPEIRDYDSPDYRKPVYILHEGRRIGCYQFTHENCFQIRLYADYESRPGWREVLLDHRSFQEDRCREWLQGHIDIVFEGLKVHHIE